MRRASRIDANQAALVAALRQAGASVQSLAAVGQGVPDLLVGYQGRTILLEVKDGSKSPSRRQLTEHQQAWHAAWRGEPVQVVDSVLGALQAIGATIDRP